MAMLEILLGHSIYSIFENVGLCAWSGSIIHFASMFLRNASHGYLKGLDMVVNSHIGKESLKLA